MVVRATAKAKNKFLKHNALYATNLVIGNAIVGTTQITKVAKAQVKAQAKQATHNQAQAQAKVTRESPAIVGSVGSLATMHKTAGARR